MKQVFFTLALIGLASCGQNECCDHNHDIVIKGRQFDFTQDDGVDDSLVIGEIEPNVDSLTTVRELLDHLETLPAE